MLTLTELTAFIDEYLDDPYPMDWTEAALSMKRIINDLPETFVDPED